MLIKPPATKCLFASLRGGTPTWQSLINKRIATLFSIARNSVLRAHFVIQGIKNKNFKKIYNFLFKKTTFKTRGFTLIEILIYIATLVILTGALINFFIWSIDASAKIKTKQTTLKEAQRAMEKILFEIKEAQSIYTPTSIFGQHPGQLSLKTTHNPPTGEVSTFIDFYLCGEQICVKQESAEAIAITSDKTIVEQLSFTRLPASSTESIQINLGLKYNTPNNKLAWQASTSLTSTATIRNHE